MRTIPPTRLHTADILPKNLSYAIPWIYPWVSFFFASLLAFFFSPDAGMSRKISQYLHVSVYETYRYNGCSGFNSCDRVVGRSGFDQKIATFQRNISQHCWAQHVACVWPPCCDVLRCVATCWVLLAQI